MDYERLKSLYEKTGYEILKIRPWMMLEIHEKVWDWESNRIWRFKWLVIKVQKPSHPDGTFTVRWTVAGVEVEKIYPLSFNKFAKLNVLDEYKVRRAKLYYIRDKIGKAAKFKSKNPSDKKEKDLLKHHTKKHTHKKEEDKKEE